MEKTEWISCATPPVREGYYQVRLWESEDTPPGYGNNVMRYYFDGSCWREGRDRYRLTYEGRPGWHKKDEWRGILKPDALAKEIEHLRETVSKLAALAQHSDDCSWITPLPTGQGYWGCDCGLNDLVLDGEPTAAALTHSAQVTGLRRSYGEGPVD